MLDKKYRGRLKGIPVRAGSVRRAREEAGLTLAEVAGEELSRTAIHLIEHGRNKPSAETLRQIAHRTHKPIEYFLAEEADELALPSELRELERLTATRDFPGVLALGAGLLGRRRTPGEQALVHFHVGQAHCRMVHPAEALDHLRSARSHFESTGDEWMAVEAMDWEAAALGLGEDPEAIPLGRQALGRCRRLEPRVPQLEARILGHLAAMHFVKQSWVEAAALYEAASAAAGSVRDLLQQAKMHHGLGTAYQKMLKTAQARDHFDRALALYSIESDLSAVYRVENDLGHLYLEQGQLDQAEQHLEKALAGVVELNIDRRGRGFVLTNLAEVRLRRGDLESAEQMLAEALAASAETGEKIVAAEAHALLGEVHERRGERSAGDDEFTSAFELLEQLEMPDRLRDCHMRYAELLAARDDVRSAAFHWKRAAEIAKLAAAGVDVSRAQDTMESAQAGA